MVEPVIIEGIRCYAPEFALGSADFPNEDYERLCRFEERHFWFQARNRIILRALHRYLKGIDAPRLLEIGCGTGYVLQALAKDGRYRLTGTEMHIAGLKHARRRLPAVEFAQVDARDLPYESAFDAIGAFDVIEHISEDETVLRSVLKALKPSGILAVTVPQHQWLWSSVDEAACHKRRYSRRELRTKLAAAGFEILKVTSFVTTLLPLMFASRFAQRKKDTSGAETNAGELEISAVTNAVCGAAMRLDEVAIGAGISLPVGGSLLAIARKPA